MAVHNSTASSQRSSVQDIPFVRRQHRIGIAVLVAFLVGASSLNTAAAAAPAEERNLLKQKQVRVSQKAVLYEEDPAFPKGLQSTGTVAWCVEQLESREGSTSNLAIRGEVLIPGDKFKMAFSIRRGADGALPEAHTVELTFNPSPHFGGEGIETVPGILLKDRENTRGTPLLGKAAKSAENVFRVDLSGAAADGQRNAQLLQRDWFDIPMIFRTKRRAILSMEIGGSGRQVFNTVLTAWAVNADSAAAADFCAVPEGELQKKDRRRALR